MSINVTSVEQAYSLPRIGIIGGAMIEQPEQADAGLYDYFSDAMNSASLFRLTGKLPLAAEKVYGPLLDQYPQAELVVPANYGVLGGSESTFQDTKNRVAATEEDPVILIGHSLGGIFAHRLAAEQPQAVVGVIKIDSPSTEAGIDSFPYNLPFHRAFAMQVLGPHFRAIRNGHDPAKIVTLGSTKSCISPENSLHLSETASNIRRILFRPEERGSDDEIYGVDVEERIADGDLSHIWLPSNPSVIQACGELLEGYDSTRLLNTAIARV
jgi:pimeloyl-ACP methyl ester carboxylesterase